MSESLIYMAFVTGLLGTGHCIGMCGGLVSALSLSDAGQKGGWLFHLLYNAGRIATYTFIGAVVGWLGSALAYTDQFKVVTRSLLVGSDIFIILVGLGTAGLYAVAVDGAAGNIDVMQLCACSPLDGYMFL